MKAPDFSAFSCSGCRYGLPVDAAGYHYNIGHAPFDPNELRVHSPMGHAYLTKPKKWIYGICEIVDAHHE